MYKVGDLVYSQILEKVLYVENYEPNFFNFNVELANSHHIKLRLTLYTSILREEEQ